MNFDYKGILPVFGSCYSFGGSSILTVDEPEEIDENRPVSIFSIARTHGLSDVFLADKSCSGLVEAYNNANKAELNLRFGFKVIYCENINDKSEKSLQTEQKIIIWLTESSGYKNFVKLVTDAQVKGFYYIPRVDKNVLKENWCSSLKISVPFYDSFIHKNLLNLGKCVPEFPESPVMFWEENDLPFDRILKEKVCEYATREKLELIPVKSIFYYKKDYYKAYLVTKCIANRSTLEKPELPFNCSDKFCFEEAKRYGINTNYRFCQNFHKLELPFWGIQLPKIKIDSTIRKQIGVGENSDNFEILKSLCVDGLRRRLEDGSISSEEVEWYKTRIKYELGILNKLGFVDYMLMVWDWIDVARKRGIPLGRGRGSSAGSAVCYLLGITDIPVKKFDLLFERFLSADRAATIEKNGITYLTDAPDIDSDIAKSRRFEIVEYLNQKYPGQTSKLINITTYQGKVLIKEVAKCVNNLEQSYLNHVTEDIPVEFGNVADIQECYEGKKNSSGEWIRKPIENFKKFCDEFPEVYKIALKLRGLPKNKSVHASGYLISHCPINEFIPTEIVTDKKENKHLASSFDMYSAGSIVVKMDLLGLKTLDIMDSTGKMVGQQFDKININDPSIYKYLSNPESPFLGIFQAEDGLGKKTLKKIEAENINHIIDSITLGRPGAMDSIPDYVDFKKGNKKPNIDPRVEHILGPTGGLLLFQEQLMALSITMGGFAPNESNGIRKCVTKDTTFVSKTRGIISIDSLIQTGFENELFLVMDEKGSQFWKPIQNIWSTGKQNVYQLSTRNGLSINLTRWHQVMTDKGWKARCYLDKESDFIITCKQLEYEGQNKISEHLAMIIVGLICEGYFVKYNSRFTNFCKQNMDKFSYHFEQEFGHIPTFYKNDYRVAHILSKDRHEINRHLAFGKSKDKKIPEILMGMDKETTRKFLSFILTCEGGLESKGFSISSKSKTLINQIKLLLLRFGVRSSYGIKNNMDYGAFFYLSIKEYSQLIKLQKELSCNFETRKMLELENLIKLRKEEEAGFTLDVIPKHLVERFKMQYGFFTTQNNPESGSLYKSNLSRTRFQKFVEKSKDNYWISLNAGKQEYSSIEDISFVGHLETFDFTVDDETPYIVANGIVIHNSVGKKDKKKMLSYKEKFLDGCKKNGFSNEYANNIWKTFEMSADYSFNKCLSPQTLVETEKGFKTMSDCKVGEKIKSFDIKNNQNHFVEIEEIYKNEVELYEIETEDGKKLQCSLDHKILCENGKMHQLREIIENNYKIITI